VGAEGWFALRSPSDPLADVSRSSTSVDPDGELGLSNADQLALLRDTMAHGSPLRMVARGFSMAPFIRDRDTLTIAPARGRAPRIGEVVAVSLPGAGQLAVHRIVARVGSRWLVRGDNASEPDGVVGPEDIVGIVTHVERGGREVRLGIGVGRVLIAWLQRTHALRPLVGMARLVRGLPRSLRGGRFRQRRG
jgi:hypothetical protein